MKISKAVKIITSFSSDDENINLLEDKIKKILINERIKKKV